MMQTEETCEALIEEVNHALLAGDWSQVAALTVELYALTVAAGETELSDLVQDLHWIANDALAHPLEVAAKVAP